MTENFDFLEAAEWQMPWTKHNTTVIPVMSQPLPPTSAVVVHTPPNTTAMLYLNNSSDDSALEQLDLSDGCALNVSSDDPEHSCMNMAVLLNTETMDALASPMPPPPHQQPLPHQLAHTKRKSHELTTTPIRAPHPPHTQAFKRSRQTVNTAQESATTSADRTPTIPAPSAATGWDDDDSDGGAADYFRTQFLKQVDSLSGDSDDHNQPQPLQHHQVGLSQFFNATQFDYVTQHPAARTTVVQPLHLVAAANDDDDDDPIVAGGSVRFTEDAPVPAAVAAAEAIQRIDDTDLNLTQLMMDGASDELPASTQRFLRDVQSVVDAGITAPVAAATAAPPPPAIDPVTIYTNSTEATAYIERQRAMSEMNEANVGDANCCDPELSQAYKSTQYRRELEAVFAHCERSICERALPTPSSDDDHLNQLDGINWTQSDFAGSRTPAANPTASTTARTPLITPSVFVRRRLEELKRVATPPKPTTPAPTYATGTSGFTGLGPFYGLPLRVKSLIRDYKGISDLYDWQKQCLSLPAIARRNNLIYALPTSGGKTLVSEILLLREVLCRRRNCLFILPYVSIVQEKMWSLSPFAVELDFLLEEYAAGKGSLPPQRRRKKRSIYIATIEKGLALLDSLIETRRANELGLIVVDELHIIGEAGRGPTLEQLLTKAMFISAGIQIVGMSATIGNIPDLARFLHADVFTRDFRPVELREYIKCGSDLMQINTPAGGGPNGAKSFDYIRSVAFGYRDSVLRRDPDHLAGLVSEVIPEQACLVFCPTKRNCENVALLLSQLLPARFRQHRAEQRAELRGFLEKEAGGQLCATLARTLPYGVAYHHSGLTGEERRHLEDAYRANILCVICCTSTLAAGVNLPAKRVILRSPYVGREFITLSRYKQMVGRAGRAGLCVDDVGESILICGPRDNVRVGELLCSPMDEAASSLHGQGGVGVQALMLSAIGLGLAETRGELEALLQTTLMAVQAPRLGVDIGQLTSDILTNLFRMKTMRLMQAPTASSGSPALAAATGDTTTPGGTIEEVPSQAATDATALDCSGSVRHIRLKPSTRMCINGLGRASFKSGFSVDKARSVYRDLQKAQRSLVLTTHLHLLYVVTPYEAASVGVRPQANVYYERWARLDRDQQLVARTLGIGEQVALRIRADKPIQSDELQRIVGRFFMTLMLADLWQQRSVAEVAEGFGVSRGVVQQLVVAAASYAAGVLKFCEELEEEFWAMRELLRMLTKRLSYCCTAELVPLMELPGVKLIRAKQLYAAGFKSLEHIAKADVAQLADAITHLNARVARQLIAAAKVLLLEKVETLREEVQDCLEVLGGRASASETPK